MKALFAPACIATELLGWRRSLLLFFGFNVLIISTLAYLASGGASVKGGDLFSFTLLALLLDGYFLTGLQLQLGAQLQQLRESVGQIGRGQYHNLPTVLGRDVAGALENDVARLGKELERMVARITQSASETHSASRSEARIAQHNADSSRHQAGAIAGVATAIEEMAASVAHVTEQITTIRQIAEETQHSASAGETVITTTIDSIQGVSGAMQQAIGSVNALGQRSGEISQIIEVIKGIANQTNLLALNAAIEAARAGEHGRGFAVVSDEVRQLAIRTHDATEKVSAMISAIQTEISGTITSINTIDHQVSGTIELGDQAGHHLHAIRAGASATVESMHAAASAITQQSQVCDDIAANIDAINQMAAASSHSASETRETSLYLEALSQRVLSILPQPPHTKGAQG